MTNNDRTNRVDRMTKVRTLLENQGFADFLVIGWDVDGRWVATVSDNFPIENFKAVEQWAAKQEVP